MQPSSLIFLIKYGRYYWFRLRERKKSLQIFWNKTGWRTSCNFYVQSNILLTADVFGNFQNMRLDPDIYLNPKCKLDPEKIFSVTGLALQAALKKTKVNWVLLIHIDMLLMVEKCIRGGRCHSVYWYEKANNNTRNIMMKIKNRHIFNIGM